MATMAKRDYYETLGVDRSASAKEIATAYRRMAARCHPDSNKSEKAHKQFKECAEAYAVLSDQEKRDAYNRYGHAGVDGSGGGFPFGEAGDIFDAFSELFGGGGGFGGRRSRVRKGRDIQVSATLTLEEAYAGVERELTFHRPESCETCEGSGAAPGSVRQSCSQCGGHGQVLQSMGIVSMQRTCPSCSGAGSVVSNPCQSCRGDGFTESTVTLTMAIPPGVDDQMTVVKPGEGQPSASGGPPGDLHCVIRVKPHSIFQRDRNRLILRLPITYTQAVLGGKVELPTLAGPEMFQIPAGTQSGHVFRIRGKGMPDPNGGPTGELAVQAFIEVPKKIDQDQEALLRQLAEIEHTQVAPQRKSFLQQVKEYFTGSESASS